MTIHLHEGDLPRGMDLGPVIAVDTETMGLNTPRDRLCLVQMTGGDGDDAHLVRLPLQARPYTAPNLASQLADPNRLKIFHFARFDMAALKYWMDVDCGPVYCTKIASKIARTYTDRHGLADLCREFLGHDLSKQQQSSDWGNDALTEAQLVYAAADVQHLHALKDRLDAVLAREGRNTLAQACFDFLPYRVALDLAGFSQGDDIFQH